MAQTISQHGTGCVWLPRQVVHKITYLQFIGVLCMVWFLFQIVLGAGSVWADGVLFGGGMKAKALWKYHR